jgi:hypothetical protein
MLPNFKTQHHLNTRQHAFITQTIFTEITHTSYYLQHTYSHIYLAVLTTNLFTTYMKATKLADSAVRM